MTNRIIIFVFFAGLLLMGSCCKDEPGFVPPNDPFGKLTEQNDLPYRLPTVSNQSDGDQTKGLFFYNKDNLDVIFRSIGVTDSATSNTKLWVQILNPDIRVFADTRVDSFYIDTILINGVQFTEIHNRENGKNFHELDTALLALPFAYDQLDTYRPNLFDNSVVTVHVQFNEQFAGTNIKYDVERGVLERTLNNYVGFKNIKDGRLFFVELENRYVLKSIETRVD